LAGMNKEEMEKQLFQQIDTVKNENALFMKGFKDSIEGMMN
jgi:hypothetical protein